MALWSRLRGKDWRRRKPLVAVVRLSGAIGISRAFRSGLTLASQAETLERAFTLKGVKAVALQINSPGGSAVQSHLLFRRIRALAEETSLPVYAFAEDVAASGGYMLALAADEIYADESSIIGSIGVLAAGFGFPKLLEKIGVERRVYTAGEHKMALDPFQPEKPEDVAHLKALQKDIHETFIGLVKQRRGEKIAEADTDLFSGAYWTGRRAEALGLIDGITDLRSKMRALYGDDVRLKLIAPRKGLFRRQMGVFHGAGAQTDLAAETFLRGGLLPPDFAWQLLEAAEERALWGRYGL